MLKFNGEKLSLNKDTENYSNNAVTTDTQSEDINEIIIETVESGDINKLQLLLQNNVDQSLQIRDEEGWSLLHIAAYRGHSSIVLFLLKNHHDPLAETPTGWNALHCAAYKGHTMVIALLLPYNPMLDSADKDGWTALHCAAYKGHKSTIQFLMKHGANPNAYTHIHQTPCQLALINHQLEVVHFFYNESSNEKAIILDENENNFNDNESLQKKDYKTNSNNNNNNQKASSLVKDTYKKAKFFARNSKIFAKLSLDEKSSGKPAQDNLNTSKATVQTSKFTYEN